MTTNYTGNILSPLLLSTKHSSEPDLCDDHVCIWNTVVQRYPTTASKIESRNMEDALTFLGVPEPFTDGLSVTHTHTIASLW